MNDTERRQEIDTLQQQLRDRIQAKRELEMKYDSRVPGVAEIQMDIARLSYDIRRLQAGKV